MTKEKLEKEAEEWVKQEYPTLQINAVAQRYIKAFLAGIEPREKRIEELEEKISVLLSCKNCPENKGGYICEKEYNNKCLAQKIQFIKELQQENAELQEKYDTCLRENTGLKIHSAYVEKKFTKAKEIIKKLKALYFSPVVTKEDVKRQDEILAEAEQFLNSEVEK